MEYPAPHPEMAYGDEPWKKWGGETILDTAGISTHEYDGQVDRYVDRFGHKIYCDSAVIEVFEDDGE